MNGDEFIRKVRKLARRKGVVIEVFKAHGKGSHQTLHYGGRRTTVKKSEIGVGLFHAMCKQLGIEPDDL